MVDNASSRPEQKKEQPIPHPARQSSPDSGRPSVPASKNQDNRGPSKNGKHPVTAYASSGVIQQVSRTARSLASYSNGITLLLTFKEEHRARKLFYPTRAMTQVSVPTSPNSSGLMSKATSAAFLMAGFSSTKNRRISPLASGSKLPAKVPIAATFNFGSGF